MLLKIPSTRQNSIGNVFAAIFKTIVPHRPHHKVYPQMQNIAYYLTRRVFQRFYFVLSLTPPLFLGLFTTQHIYIDVVASPLGEYALDNLIVNNLSEFMTIIRENNSISSVLCNDIVLHEMTHIYSKLIKFSCRYISQKLNCTNEEDMKTISLTNLPTK